MNFDNQGIVSGTFLRQWWFLLLVDGTIYLTDTYCKMHFTTMGCTTPPQKYLNYTKINLWQGHEIWTLVAKAIKFLDKMGILLIRDGYFYIGRVLIITIFLWQFLVITQSYHYNAIIALLQKPQTQPLEVSCKRRCS